MSKVYGVYGASGYGRECMPIAKEMLSRQGISTKDLYFIDDAKQASEVNDHKVVTFDEFVRIDSTEKMVSIAIADFNIRKKIAEKVAQSGMEFFSIISNNSIALDEVKILEGAILNPFTMLTSNISIGKHFQANIYSYVAHDCIIGDFVTLGPSAKVNGNVHVGDNVYIGAGAVIRQGSPDEPVIIGDGAVVGMGAVVLRSVSPGAVVVGNPAKERS